MNDLKKDYKQKVLLTIAAFFLAFLFLQDARADEPDASDLSYDTESIETASEPTSVEDVSVEADLDTGDDLVTIDSMDE